ncbi:hypothetical protein HIM_05912 [Hirsutella minnesotensis 3608]|uniref:C2H2-type domain-containing protein n=1 Tax=Hirsutella minnesotensis 3608 TaxID=1043627 RepID=A0A0F7ZP32_9HYPO|nr:hypothetical protein HIM_05912 [Hirsutella minnesotensis 3608]
MRSEEEDRRNAFAFGNNTANTSSYDNQGTDRPGEEDQDESQVHQTTWYSLQNQHLDRPDSMEATSFSSRRAAANALPAFSLPPPNAEIPSMDTSPSSIFSSQSLTSSPGAGDGLSPGMSSVNTASSQGSQQQSSNQYHLYANSGPVQPSWETSTGPSFHVNTSSQAQSAHQTPGPSPYGPRSSIYAPQSAMGFSSQRSSQSPATGADGLSAPPYDTVHHSFNASLSNGGGGPGSGGGGGGLAGHHSLSPIQATPHNAFSTPHHSTQPPASSAPAPVDSYAHSRPPSTSAYYAATTTPHQPTFPSYAPHPGHSQPSPTSSAPRGMGSLSGPSMGPPQGYRTAYNPYPNLSHPINGPVMSNIHQPGSQMSVISGLGMSHAYGGHTLMYGHPHAQPQSQPERPFKCEQCTQSFSRNHDLKRHRRIHLAVKPFPCNFCSKSFSRKDALKRHRLVKGCENKAAEAANAEGMATGRNVDGEDDRSSAEREP